MEHNFIYVFSPAARDEMLAAGFVLLKEDDNSSLYIFKSDDKLTFTLNDASYVISDTLSF